MSYFVEHAEKHVKEGGDQFILAEMDPPGVYSNRGGGSFFVCQT